MINLYNEDCLQAMKKMDDNSYDLAIVDPPYRDDNQPTIEMRKAKVHRSLYGRPSQIYFDELFRVSKNQIIWGCNNFNLPCHKGFIVWRKKSISENFTMSMCEIAYISEKLGTISKFIELQPQIKTNKIHPTQKPVDLYKWILKNYAKQGDTILDTHLGSGSIALACHDFGYDLDGYEINKTYYEAASKRVREYQRQLKLF